MKKFRFTNSLSKVLLAMAPVIVLAWKSFMILGEPQIPEHFKKK